MFILSGFLDGEYVVVEWDGESRAPARAMEAYQERLSAMDGVSRGIPPHDAAHDHDSVDGAAIAVWGEVLDDVTIILPPVWASAGSTP